MIGYYDRQGRPLDMTEWAKLFADFAGRVIARHEESDYRVSTVWLGADHRLVGNGPPLIFETMIFPQDSLDELYCERYATEPAALAGHDRAVAHLRAEILGGAS